MSRACLSDLSSSEHLAGKRCILVGAKSDLVRTRLVSPSEGTSAAIQHGVKFTEISAGVGCNIDSLLVGIVLQCRSVQAINREEGGYNTLRRTSECQMSLSK